jgi:RNA polymerase sigma-70 factor (ECF subfamily)
MFTREASSARTESQFDLASSPTAGIGGAFDDDDQERLLDRVRAGAEDACEELVRRFGGRVFATVRGLLSRDEDAQDVVQETFLSAFRSVRQFRGECLLSTWLHRIAINAALMKLRSAAHRPETSIEELLPQFDGEGRHAFPIAPWSLTPSEALLRRDTRSRVRAAIERLPMSYRTVLILRDIEELSTEETARALSLTTAAVKTRLHRARLALRTLLEPIFAPTRRLAV